MVDKSDVYTFPKNEYALQEGPAYDERVLWDGTYLNYCPGCGEEWDGVSNNYGCEIDCPELQLENYHDGQTQPFIDYLSEGEVDIENNDWERGILYMKKTGASRMEDSIAASANPDTGVVRVPWWTLRNKGIYFSSIPHEVAHITIEFKLDAVLKMLSLPEPPRSLEELNQAEDGVLGSISQYNEYLNQEQENIRILKEDIKSGVSRGVVGPGGKPSKLTQDDIDFIYSLIDKSKERAKKLEKDIKDLESGLNSIRQEMINHPETSTVAEVKAGWLQSVKDYETYSVLKEIRQDTWSYGGNFDKRGAGHWTEWRDESDYMFEKALKGFGHLNYGGATNTSNVSEYPKSEYAFKSEQFKSALQQLREKHKKE